MKTVEEFIQRLQTDLEFEQKAEAYENSNEFIQFVRRQGYDFTLEQLMEGFKQGKASLKSQANRSPVPLKVVEASETPMPEELSESGKQAKPSPDRQVELPKRPRSLCPNFEGRRGGRRRGMKWRTEDH